MPIITAHLPADLARSRSEAVSTTQNRSEFRAQKPCQAARKESVSSTAAGPPVPMALLKPVMPQLLNAAISASVSGFA